MGFFKNVFGKESRARAAKKRKTLPLPLRVLTSTKTTAVLGATLGALLFPSAALGLVKSAGRAAAPKTFGGAVRTAILAPVAGGLIVSSPKIRDIAKRTLSPSAQFERGKFIGGLIEDPSGLLPEQETAGSVGERIRQVAGAAGLVAGGIAAATGGVILAKKAVRGAAPITFQQLPSSVAPVIEQPLGAVQPPEEEKKVAPTQLPTIKITNKPQNNIDISFRKSKKFINQQVLVR